MKYAALVRALNVGGTGKLTMKQLVACCAKAGFADATTYIASGNAIFDSKLAEPKVKAALEKTLTAEMGAEIDVLVRSHDELASIVKKNPFPSAAPNQVIVIFLDAPPKAGELDVVAPAGEQVRAIGRDVYVHYPNGQGTSKLKLPFAARGTGRNLNTVGKLATLTA